MKLLISLLFLANATANSSEAIVDGIYRSAQDTSARSVRSQDGRMVSLGARQDLQFLGKELRSQGNANETFSLSLTIPFDAELVPGTYVLAVAGTVYRQTTSGSSGQGTSSLHFQISGEDKAREVALYLDSPVVLFRHPGHRLRVAFTPTKPSFDRDEPVSVILQIVNVGAEAVAFMKGGRSRATRDNQYVFAAYRGGEPVPDIGRSAHFGGLSAPVVLEPSATFEDTIDLSRWFDFEEAGLYEIHGSYRLNLVNPGTLPLLPSWRDFASADFTVAIK